MISSTEVSADHTRAATLSNNLEVTLDDFSPPLLNEGEYGWALSTDIFVRTAVQFRP